MITLVSTEEENNQILSGHYSYVIDQSTGVDSEAQGATESTLSGVEHFQKNDEIYVVFTIDDGVNDSYSITSNRLRVKNSAPTTPTVVINLAAVVLMQLKIWFVLEMILPMKILMMLSIHIVGQMTKMLSEIF